MIFRTTHWGSRPERVAPYAHQMAHSTVIPPTGLPDALASIRRCLVMSVVNVTPDSFSDGGEYLDAKSAITRGLEQRAAGADLIDVGGESTRPGAERVPADVEHDRVLPVVKGLVAEGVFVSIDTMRADIARRAVDAGAVLVNDVSGGLSDPAMLEFLAVASVPCVLMHWRGPSLDMQTRTHYPRGVVTEVRQELSNRLSAAAAGGGRSGAHRA